ncbi:Tubulin beta-1 chain-like protein, partial [Drosera capensis]
EVICHKHDIDPSGQSSSTATTSDLEHEHINVYFDEASGVTLIDAVLDVVRKEAESCDCLQEWTV